MIKFPKDDSRFRWTKHIKNKMVFYHISLAQIMRIFRSPERVEEGIAERTIGAMRTRKKGGNKKGEEEIWIMYRANESRVKNYELSEEAKNKGEKRARVIMISAWRYPGKTKPGERPEIPMEIIDELTIAGYL